MKRFTLIYIICAWVALLPLSGQNAGDFIVEARSGNPTAQYNLAQCHLYGWGTPVDSIRWRHFLRQAAEGGLVQAREQMAALAEPHYPDIASYWRGAPSTIPHRYSYLSYEQGYYYGEQIGGVRDGYGTFVWDSGVSHTGVWDDGEPYDMGISRFGEQTVICTYSGEAEGPGAIIIHSDSAHFPGAEGSVIYVGYIEDGQPNGRGTLYNREGHLTYFGNFKNGRPTDPYPSKESYNSYTWTSEQLSTGDSWEGEKHNGIRQGFGIYRWIDGSAWYGMWVNDLREGQGLYIRADGAMMTGLWTNGTLNQAN